MTDAHRLKVPSSQDPEAVAQMAALRKLDDQQLRDLDALTRRIDRLGERVRFELRQREGRAG